MNTIKGKLVVQGKRIMVALPTKKGTANFPIPLSAKRFRDGDAKDGLEVDVERDAANRIIKVTIPGTQELAPRAEPAPTSGSGYRGPKGDERRQQPARHDRPADAGSKAGGSRSTRKRAKAPPKTIGYAFHNPYTFIGFEGEPSRELPAQLTADEMRGQSDRVSGVLQLRVTTTSPLLTCNPVPVGADKNKPLHKIYEALAIGQDVIVPATGVRGSLRTLLTVLTSGTLGYIDRHAFLIQGRDCNLGPRSKFDSENAKIPDKLYLGLVETPGSVQAPGRIRLGETRLVRLTSLKQLIGEQALNRSPDADNIWLELDSDGNPIDWSKTRTDVCCWRLRLSGRPVGGFRREEKKREGVFKPGDRVIEVPADLWADYAGRNAHGARAILKRDDLVWLEPKESGVIASPKDIASLQWARWGRTGTPLEKRVPAKFHPDSGRDDQLVDIVTNLFGQVPERLGSEFQNAEGDGQRPIAFAGRVRPDNLVFAAAKSNCRRVTLAPLAPPHPGCLAFYRDNDDPDAVHIKDPVRGYKVYRTTSQQGDDAPWLYENQGVYVQNRRSPPAQNTNKTVELLPSGSVGSLQIAFRALKKEELALLIQACHVPWRLAGGKPLGLGACRVEVVGVLDEFGRPSSVHDLIGDWKTLIEPKVAGRVNIWSATQDPVPLLRYPRATRDRSRGGYAWFQTFARPQMRSGDESKPGITALPIGGELLRQVESQGELLDDREPKIAAQILPHFDPDDIMADVLYGYDVEVEMERGERNVVVRFNRPRSE